MWRSYSRISYVHLLKPRSFSNCSLYFRIFLVSALPLLCDGPEYLSRRFAKHGYRVVLRNILRGMFEENEMVFAASNHGSLG
jgi:hypothetical protein